MYSAHCRRLFSERGTVARISTRRADGDFHLLAFALSYDMAIRSNGFSSSSVFHCSPNHACDAVIRLAICRGRGCPPMKTRLEGIDVLCGVVAPWSGRLVAAAAHR